MTEAGREAGFEVKVLDRDEAGGTIGEHDVHSADMAGQLAVGLDEFVRSERSTGIRGRKPQGGICV